MLSGHDQILCYTYPIRYQFFSETMESEKEIPFESIEGMFNRLGEEWHSSEYYISPDRPLPKDPLSLPVRPDFYGLFLCVEGWMNIKINDKLIHVVPYCMFAINPDSIVQRSDDSPDCK